MSSSPDDGVGCFLAAAGLALIYGIVVAIGYVIEVVSNAAVTAFNFIVFVLDFIVEAVSRLFIPV